MLALIMSGGLGTRLGNRMIMGEKPLVILNGRPLLNYVTDAFETLGYEVIAVVTPKVPMTRNYCRVNGIQIYDAPGDGYVEDLFSCIGDIGTESPLFTCTADLPGVTSLIVDRVCSEYEKSGKDACSVWVPEEIFRKTGCIPNYTEMIDGVSSSPVGLNIVKPDDSGEMQDELKLLLHDQGLTFNVNTPEELKLAEEFFK